MATELFRLMVVGKRMCSKGVLHFMFCCLTYKLFLGIIVIGITLKCAIYAQTPTKHPSHHHCCCHHHRYRHSRDFGNAGDGERVIKFMKLLPTQHFMLAMFLIKLFLTHNRCHYWCFGAVNAIMSQFECKLCFERIDFTTKQWLSFALIHTPTKNVQQNGLFFCNFQPGNIRRSHDF